MLVVQTIQGSVMVNVKCLNLKLTKVKKKEMFDLRKIITQDFHTST